MATKHYGIALHRARVLENRGFKLVKGCYERKFKDTTQRVSGALWSVVDFIDNDGGITETHGIKW